MRSPVVLKTLIFVGVAFLNSSALAQARAPRGGDSAGGGNLWKATGLVPAPVLERKIREARFSAALAAQSIEADEAFESGPGDIVPRDPEQRERARVRAELISGGSPNLYDVLREAPIKTPAGPCLDGEGRERDASAVNGELCFSLSRLQAKLNVMTLDREIVALMLHEASHLVGADEETAVDLQQRVLFRPDFGRTMESGRQFASAMARLLDLRVRHLEEILRALGSGERFRTAAICGVLRGIGGADPLNEFAIRFRDADRLRLLAPAALRRQVVSTMKIDNVVEGFCAEEKALSARELDGVLKSREGAAEYEVETPLRELQIQFGRAGRLTLKSYSEKVGHGMSDMLFVFPEEDVIRFVAPGDVAAARTELGEALAASRKARALALDPARFP